jgi:membrane fusion protein, multidrug efflux system
VTVVGSKSGRRHALARGAGGLAVIVVVVLGLWAWKERQATASIPPPAAADTLQVALTDSVAADSTGAESKHGGLLGLFQHKSKGKNSKPEPVPVELASVESRDVPSFFVGTATIEAEQRADILSKVAGTVQRLHVEEGEDVRAGDVLLEIDAAEPAARLLETRVRLESLERELERVSALHEKGLASDREFEDQKLQVEQARAQLEVGQIAVDWATVRAPFAGRITARSVDVGQTVTVGTPLVSIADLDPLLARVYMPEKQVERVQLGQDVQIVPESQPTETFAGRVDLIAPVVDPRSGTVKVTVALAGSPDRLRPGAFVRALIKTDVHEDALVVPKRAVVSEGGDSFVFRCVADSVLKVRVETGYTDDRYAEVVSGLTMSDRVVTVGQGGLRHGTHVRELPAAIAGAAPQDSSGVVRR